MRIPKYWERTSSSETIKGKLRNLSAWGHSNTSEEDARHNATQRLSKVRIALSSGIPLDTYEYLANPIREQRLELYDNEIDPYAIITRNGYGARVLNAPRVMFVDIDVDVTTPGFWASLFGKKRKSPTQEAIERVEQWVESNRTSGFRIYETPAGLRLIATDKLYDPVSNETAKLLADLNSDEMYRRLCKAQKCFRARLSAKPWRIEMERCPIRYPEPHTKDKHAAWCQLYESKAAPYSACRFIKSVGSKGFVSEIERVTQIHDREAKATFGGKMA